MSASYLPLKAAVFRLCRRPEGLLAPTVGPGTVLSRTTVIGRDAAMDEAVRVARTALMGEQED